MGFMVCIFSCIYFIYSLIINNIKPFKEIKDRIRLFIVFSAISALIAGIILIPAYIGIRNGRASYALSDVGLFDVNFKLNELSR